jgi:diphthine synthase
MALYLVGLGLADETDVTVKGLEVIRRCRRVYLEHYTSVLSVGLERLQAFYRRDDLILADRDFVESQAEHVMLAEARDGDVAFLVVGDPFGATTHADLRLRAHRAGVPVHVVHNASIMNAVAACGLQLYRFGQAVSMCFWTERWQPDSYYDKIVENRRRGLHTLCLLDIKVKEASEENILRGKGHLHEPPRFMTVSGAIEQLLQIAQGRDNGGEIHEQSLMVGLARVGASDQLVSFGPACQLQAMDFGPPLHCLVVPAELHDVERQVLQEIFSPL